MSSAYAIGDRAGAGTSNSRFGSAPSTAARLARPVILCLTILCALFFLARYAVLPALTVRHIIFRSDVALSEDELLAISGLQGTAYWHSLATDIVRRRLENYPLIKRAVVEKVFPDTIRMTVWGRQPVALVLADMGGRSLPVLVDEEGVIFKVCSTAAELDLPVVSGLPPTDASLGERLPSVYAQLFMQLKQLRDKSPSLMRLVSEVRIVSYDSPAGSYDLLIYLTTSPVPVLAAGTLDESLLRYSLMVLDLLSKQGVLKNIQELDFRSGNVVYRMKEG